MMIIMIHGLFNDATSYYGHTASERPYSKKYSFVYIFDIISFVKVARTGKLYRYIDS